MSDNQPPYDGLYRIKVLEKGLYLEYVLADQPFIVLAPHNPDTPRQVWDITPSDNADTCTIKSAYDGAGLVATEIGDEETFDGSGCPRPLVGRPSTNWILKRVEEGGKQFTRILYGEDQKLVFDCASEGHQVHFSEVNSEHVNQDFDFEALGKGSRGRSDIEEGEEDSEAAAEKTFEQNFFTFTVDAAKSYDYDIIIVGTGIGGGVLANDLFETNSRLGKNAKHILVIEKGGLVFHSHCLNAARPSGLGADRGQQNDTFFAKFKRNYHLSQGTDARDVKAGEMFSLGGRSAAWGLFAPRIHDETLSNDFPSQVKSALLDTYYRQAEALMNLSLPTTRTVHQNLMERLNMSRVANVQWQWGRIASEFNEERNFNFAEGAYSPIDKLLEIAMSKPKGADGNEEEHENFKILLRTEVREVIWDGNRAAGVLVQGRDGNPVKLRVKKEGQVILAAGSVGSAAILLRSGKSVVDVLNANDALHVTDHDIFARSASFRYREPADRNKIGAMKLQTYTKVKRTNKPDEIVLINMSIDASSFLPRSNALLHDSPQWIIAFIRPAELNKENYVKLKDNEPVIQFNRNKPFSLDDEVLQELKKLTKEIQNTLSSALNMTWIDRTFPGDEVFFKPLEMGGVAHELGTIPMKRSDNATKYCLDERLKFRDHEGLYVCDLSVFASSPEVNPTLTLAALALRLSRETLLPWVLPDGSSAQDEYLYVMNHSGEKIKVYVSNRSQTDISQEKVTTVLGPGDYEKWKRKPQFTEAVRVQRISWKNPERYFSAPEFWSGRAGTITFVV